MNPEIFGQKPLPFQRCAAYMRYSTNIQRPASIDQQVRVCRDFADQNNCVILNEHIYKDEAMSGTLRAGRKGLEALEAAIRAKPKLFDCVLVDDTSRIARDVQDILTFVRLLKDHDIGIRFVSQNLDSRDEANFEMALHMHAMIDQQYISRLKMKVKSGQRDQVLKGYHVGSIPYGYGRIVEASADEAAVGRAKTLGTHLKVNAEQAKIINRIFLDFASGASILGIVKMLNLEGIPWPHAKHGQWGEDAVKRILHNEKYNGVYAWGMSTYVKNHETGQVSKRKKPAEEHTRMDKPHLRVVPKELWDRVQERLVHLGENQNARVLGGYHRAKDREYPLSGLLYCGECGTRMKMGGKQGAGVYECPNHRRRGGCNNALRIREDLALAQIADAMQQRLLLPSTLEFLVSSVHDELDAFLKDQRKHDINTDLNDLEQSLRELQKNIKNVMRGIEISGSDALAVRLQTLDFQERRLEEQITRKRSTRTFRLSKTNLAKTVTANVAELTGVLKSNPGLARQLFQQHLKRLNLYPAERNGVPVFEVLGEMDLFNPTGDPELGVLLGVSGTLNDQQHTVDSSFRFTLTIDCSIKSKCTILEPLCGLLAAHPELADSPKTPSDWARLLNEFIADGPDKPRDLGYGTIARAYWFFRDELEERLVISKLPNPIPYNAGHVYQFALRSPTSIWNDGAGELLEST